MSGWGEQHRSRAAKLIVPGHTILWNQQGFKPRAVWRNTKRGTMRVDRLSERKRDHPSRKVAQPAS